MPTVSVSALGLNHNTAPLDLRGRFAFAPEQLGGALRGLSLRAPRLAAEADQAKLAIEEARPVGSAGPRQYCLRCG